MNSNFAKISDYEVDEIDDIPSLSYTYLVNGNKYSSKVYGVTIDDPNELRNKLVVYSHSFPIMSYPQGGLIAVLFINGIFFWLYILFIYFMAKNKKGREQAIKFILKGRENYE